MSSPVSMAKRRHERMTMRCLPSETCRATTAQGAIVKNIRIQSGVSRLLLPREVWCLGVFLLTPTEMTMGQTGPPEHFICASGDRWIDGWMDR